MQEIWFAAINGLLEAILFQIIVLDGLPRLRLIYGHQYKAAFAISPRGFRSACPIHFHSRSRILEINMNLFHQTPDVCIGNGVWPKNARSSSEATIHDECLQNSYIAHCRVSSFAVMQNDRLHFRLKDPHPLFKRPKKTWPLVIGLWMPAAKPPFLLIRLPR